MKVGDRVMVIAERDEYQGLRGSIVDLTPEGKLIVDVEIPIKYRVPFDAHDVELEALAETT